ncbi:MAG: hypothetical protein ACUVS2_13235 [Candidatus Flexifilum sp.]|jgi:hypothetical protein
MTYLNAQQREQLREDLLKLPPGRAKARVKSLDSKSRLVLYRNMQRVGQYTTAYVLPTLGVRVSLIEGEALKEASRPGWFKRKYDLVDVVVTPTPENKG